MRLLRVGTGTAVSFHRAAALTCGGEGCIYPVPQDPSLLAKIYHQPSVEHARKLALMVAHPIDDPMAARGHVAIAWPVDLLRDLDRRGEVVGFLMRRVNDVFPIVSFYNPSGRRQCCPLFNWHYLHQTARNLASAFAAIHKRGDLVADVNSRNILASPRALITLVDTDSFQVRDPNDGHVFRCPVGTAEYTPPELQNRDLATLDRTVEHDCFGLAIVLFQLLMEGTHPFAGTYLDGGDPPPYEERIRLGHFPYAEHNSVPYRPMPIAPRLSILYPLLQHLFVRCFEEGHRNPAARPDALTWQNALEEAETSLVSCTVNVQHRFGKHLAACPWCERKKLLGGRDPFPSIQGVQRGEHLQPPPGTRYRQRPQTSFTRVLSARILHGGRQVLTVQLRKKKRHAGLPPVPMRPLHPAHHRVTAHARAQRQRRISSAVAVVITVGFGLAALSVGDWKTRVLAAGVALMALYGQKLFQKYPNLFALAGIGYTGFTLLMVAGVLTAVLVRSALNEDSPTVLALWLLVIGIGYLRLVDWRFSFLLKYAIFFSFALISALFLGSGSPPAQATTPRVAITPPASSRNIGPRPSLQPAAVHADIVESVAWSPDGETLASASLDQTVKLWNAKSRQLVRILSHSSHVYALAWSPDGKTLASGSWDGTVRLWNTDSWSLRVTLNQSGGVTSLAWSPDSSAVASSGWEGSIKVWSADGRLRYTLEQNPDITSLAWSPDGKILASGSLNKSVTLWNTTSGHRLETENEITSVDSVLSLAWSPDGQSLAVAGLDRRVTIWRVYEGRVVWILHTLYRADNGPVRAIAWNANGTLLASASDDHTIAIWLANTGNLWRSVHGETGQVQSIAWRPEGTTLAIADNHMVRLWSVDGL